MNNSLRKREKDVLGSASPPRITTRLAVQKGELPLVSIIVLTYNQQHLLKDCLASILNQKYPKLELIVCDDASPDFNAEETTRMIESLKSANLKNYVVFQQPQNAGTTENARKGIELSSGEIFKLHAGDDMLRSPSAVGNIVLKFLHDENIRIIAGRSVACTPDGKLLDQFYPSAQAISKMRNTNCVGQFKLMSTQAWGEYINAPAVFWTRELYDEIGGFDPQYKYTEDWPTWLTITQKGIKITCISDVTTIYRYGGISNSASDSNKILGKLHYEECARMLETIAIPELKKNKDQKSLKKCNHCIEAIRARILYEGDWAFMSYYERLMWKLTHIRFLMRSKFYRQGAAGFRIPVDNRLAMMSLLMLLAFFFIQQSPAIVFTSRILCVAALFYFGFFKRRWTAHGGAALLLCFLFYIVQAGILPVHNASLLWAQLFTVVLAVYLVLSMVSAVTHQYLLYKERREL